MKSFLKNYKYQGEDNINYDMINRTCDGELVDYIVDCCYSLEALDSIKFLGYEYITDESDINTSEYISARQRNNRNKDVEKRKKLNPNECKYMHMKDSRYAELRLKFRIEFGDESEVITKKILIPVPDENGYYTIKGIKYFLMYQIVESSTYTTKKSLVLKSMRGISISTKPATDLLGKIKLYEEEIENPSIYNAPLYTMVMYKKEVPIITFYLAKIGLIKTMEYFNIDKIVNFTESIISPDNVYLQISSKLYIEVSRYYFEKYQYVRSMVLMIVDITTNRMTMELMLQKRTWVELLGSHNGSNKNTQYEKGLNALTYFERLVDNTTSRILKIDPIYKKNIFSVIKWMITHFNELRQKENLDLGNKRIRCNEYIASLLVMEFNKRVDRIINLGNKTTMKDIKDIFKFPGDIILHQLYKSGLLKYNDGVNDMDFFGKLKCTFKGPNSLGGGDEKTISPKYRSIDPSYIGKLDLNVCGSSDPGTTALLTPFCKLYDMYFDENKEPENFKYLFDKDIYNNGLDNNIDDGKVYASPNFESKDKYYKFINKNSEIRDKIKIKTQRTNKYEIFIKLDDEI